MSRLHGSIMTAAIAAALVAATLITGCGSSSGGATGGAATPGGSAVKQPFQKPASDVGKQRVEALADYYVGMGAKDTARWTTHVPAKYVGRIDTAKVEGSAQPFKIGGWQGDALLLKDEGANASARIDQELSYDKALGENMVKMQGLPAGDLPPIYFEVKSENGKWVVTGSKVSAGDPVTDFWAQWVKKGK